MLSLGLMVSEGILRFSPCTCLGEKIAPGVWTCKFIIFQLILIKYAADCMYLFISNSFDFNVKFPFKNMI